MDSATILPGRRLVDGRTAAAKAGCSYRHWLRMCDAGLAPWGCKLGSLRRWSVEEIDRWIADGCPRVRPLARSGREG